MMREFVCALLLSVPSVAWTCKCDTSSVFLANVAGGQVVVAKITAHGKYEMTVDVESVLGGDVKPGSITVLGGDGGNCNAGIDQFPVGTRWVLALNGNTKNGYNLSHCGTHWLKLDGEQASGKVREGVSRISLRDLTTQITAARRRYEAWAR